MSTSRFSGLMSRCTMLRWCRYCTAPDRLYTMALESLSEYLVEEVIASNRSPPWVREGGRGRGLERERARGEGEGERESGRGGAEGGEKRGGRERESM